MMIALDMDLGPFHEIVVAGGGEALAGVLDALHAKYIPNHVLAFRAEPSRDGGSPLLNPIFIGREPKPDGPSIYICEKFACQAPLHATEAEGKFQELATAGL